MPTSHHLLHALLAASPLFVTGQACDAPAQLKYSATATTCHHPTSCVDHLNTPVTPWETADFNDGSTRWLTAESQRQDAYATFTFAQAANVDHLTVANLNQYADGSREVRNLEVSYYDDAASSWVVATTHELACSCTKVGLTNPMLAVPIADSTPASALWRVKMKSFWGPSDPYGGLMRVQFWGCAENPTAAMYVYNPWAALMVGLTRKEARISQLETELNTTQAAVAAGSARTLQLEQAVPAREARIRQLEARLNATSAALGALDVLGRLEAQGVAAPWVQESATTFGANGEHRMVCRVEMAADGELAKSSGCSFEMASPG